jgi:hypothetical protein
MRLRVFAWCLALGVVAALIACGGLPTRSNRPATINVSGEELAPVATLPSGAPAAGHGALGAIVAALGAQPSPARPSPPGRPVREDFVPCGGCGGCGCCGWCGCGCCACSCSPFDGGGGGLNYSCVTASEVETTYALCGGSDVWELYYSDDSGSHDTGESITQQTECTPFQGEAAACMPPVTTGGAPGGNGTCSSQQEKVAAGAPDAAISSGGYINWTGHDLNFQGQSGYCDGTSCQFDVFYQADSGQPVPYQVTDPVCN